MTRAIPATQMSPLISRLNALRAGRGLPDEALGQIKFAAKGLSKSDPAGFLSINGMIAALEGDRSGLDVIAQDLEERFPYDTQDHLNVVRSYMSLREYSKADLHASKLLGRMQSPDPDLISWVSYAALLNGSLERAAELVQEYENFLDNPAAFGLFDTAQILTRMKSLDITQDELRGLQDHCFALLAEEGWHCPGHTLSSPMSGHEDPYPAAVLRFLVTGQAEDILEVNERVMDGLIALGEPLFLAGKVAITVRPHDAHDDA